MLDTVALVGDEAEANGDVAAQTVGTRREAPKTVCAFLNQVAGRRYSGWHRSGLKAGAVHLRFYVDRETGLPHILSHGVEEGEVEDVLASPGEDRPGREGSRIAIGQTLGGRYLRVIYVPDLKPDQVFVITAYELRGKPLVAFRRRMRRRGR